MFGEQLKKTLLPYENVFFDNYGFDFTPLEPERKSTL
jgi:hypothetical protein